MHAVTDMHTSSHAHLLTWWAPPYTTDSVNQNVLIIHQIFPQCSVVAIQVSRSWLVKLRVEDLSQVTNHPGFIVLIIILVLALILYTMTCLYLILKSIHHTSHRTGSGGASHAQTRRRWNPAEVHEWGQGGLGAPTSYLDDIDIEGPREVSEDECSWHTGREEGGVLGVGVDSETTGYDVAS